MRYLLLLQRGATGGVSSQLASSLSWSGSQPVATHAAALAAAHAAEAAAKAEALRAVHGAAQARLRAEAATAGAPQPPAFAADDRLDAAADALLLHAKQGVAGAEAGSAAHAPLGSGGCVASLSCARAVSRELRALSRASAALSLAVSLPDESNALRWRVALRGWETCAPLLHSNLADRAASTGLAPEVLLELLLPGDYPFSPPFVRVVSPVFAFRTGRVTVGGSLCTELLTPAGWSPAVSMELLLVAVRAQVADGEPRLDKARWRAAYGEAEARDAFARVARQHGWIK